MTSSLFPGFIRVEYQSNGHLHEQVLPVKPFENITGGFGVEKPISPAQYANWKDAVDAYIGIMKAFFVAGDTILSASLWTLDSPTADPLFVDEYSLAVVGTGTSAVTPNSQLTVSARTNAGGLLRFYFMEGSFSVNTKATPPSYAGLGTTATPASAMAALRTFVIGTDNFIFGRDGGRPISFLRAFGKVNDILRKKFLLDD